MSCKSRSGVSDAAQADSVVTVGHMPPSAEGAVTADGKTTPSTSIYQQWSRPRRALVLAVVSISQFLNPLSSSIILPSLQVTAER